MKSINQFEVNKFDRKELEGKKFGKLTVIDFNLEKSQALRMSVWNCKCDCGNTTTIQRQHLLSGKRQDCGRCIESLTKPGTKFGKLTVINQDLELSKARNKAMMHCKCDCGKDYYCSRSDLINGKRTECLDCVGSPKRDTEDITGRKFGKLRAIKYDPDRSKAMKKTVWECKCDCGNTIYTTISNLKGGISTSCGCQRKETIQNEYKINMIDKRFGRLVVKSENIEASKKIQDSNGNIKSTIPYYNCDCDCGNTITVPGSGLREGSITSCGQCYKHEDLTGQEFGRLKVLEYVGSKVIGKSSYGFWKCKCTCGNEVEVSTQSLKSGNTKSCGCLIKDSLKSRGTHGVYYNELRGKYKCIKSRCYDPNNEYYNDYGGRGITMCDRWLGDKGLDNFYNDMLDGFQPGLTIDRINVNGPYSPENCRWATREEQNYNKRSNVYVDYYGKKICLAELAKHFAKTDGVNASVLSHRLRHGYTIDEALSKPLYSNCNKNTYFQDPNNRPITQPFMFKEELEAMGIYAQDIDYGKELKDVNKDNQDPPSLLNVHFSNN